ncbi:MAG: leucine-rich repeat protein [Tenericutes bacterium]|nr:leucine-rich repeat protein [Mycoplasmatota bacterium]
MIKEDVKNKGLTLIELIAVIVILGIISGVGTLLIGNIIPTIRQNADIATLSNINAAMDLYKYSQSDTLETFYTDSLSDSERLAILFEEGYLSKTPSPQRSTNEYVFQIETQQWAMTSSDGEIIYTPTAEEYFTVNPTYPYLLTAYNITGGLDVVIPSEIDGVQITTIDSTCFTGLGINSVIIPDGITRISGNSFKENNLTTLVVPNSVLRIWHNAFNDNQITSVSFGTGLTRIEGGAFSNNSITEVSLPANVVYVGDGAFGYGDNFITRIEIGSNVEIVNDHSFGWYGKTFRALYNVSKEAGTYIYSGGTWVKQT